MDDETFHRLFAQRELFAREVGAEIEIEAPAAVVWSVIEDLDNYDEWNRFTPNVKAELRPQTIVALEVHGLMPWSMVWKEWINRVEPGRAVYWGLRLGHPALLVSNREQRVEALGPARTRYFTADRFSGLLVPLVFAMFGRGMQRGFDAVAQGLKARAEALALEGGLS